MHEDARHVRSNSDPGATDSCYVQGQEGPRMSRQLRALSAAFAAASMFAGCAVAGLPDSVRPTGMSGEHAWPDVVAAAPARSDGRRDAALIVSVEDYRSLPDRPHANTLAGAWYRYLHEQRGVRASRIFWLRDGAVTRASVHEALQGAHFATGVDATLWIIIIGHIGSSPDAESGVLLDPETAPGARDPVHEVPLLELLARGGHGFHRRLVTVLDGCLTTHAPGATALRSGVTAPRLPSLLDWLRLPGFPPPVPGLWSPQEMAEQMAQFDRELRRREPADVVVFTSGVGVHCTEELPGSGFPALSYLLLGALRGWADADADGRVTASEALGTVDRLLRAAGDRTAVGLPEARGSDLVLARDVQERGPAVPEAALARGEHAAGEAVPRSRFVDERMVKIDRGRFRLGCRSRNDPACEPDEYPPRRIFLDSFAIDIHEVSWRQYAACVGAGACSPIAVAQCEVWTGEAFQRGAEIPENFRGAEQPVVCATWSQAAAFCAWEGKRLPTEAEWERAARSPESRHQYPWGDSPPSCARAQTYQCGYVTSPAGSHPKGASPEGVQDLAGNVSEWVDDWYHPRAYRHLARHNPAGPDSGRVRVVRGGSFYDGFGYLRTSYRYGLSPQFGYGTVGFRCAR